MTINACIKPPPMLSAKPNSHNTTITNTIIRKSPIDITPVIFKFRIDLYLTKELETTVN